MLKILGILLFFVLVGFTLVGYTLALFQGADEISARQPAPRKPGVDRGSRLSGAARSLKALIRLRRWRASLVR